MSSEISTVLVSKASLRFGRTMSGFVILFLFFDGLTKVVKLAPVIEACQQLEIPLRVIPGLGVVLLILTVLYTVPSTSILGAVLLTGYLGGATWTHVRMGGPLFPIIFPGLVAAIAWGGLLLREPRLRALLPLRR